MTDTVPESSQNETQHCPACRAPLPIDRTQPFGDVACRRCGCKLWFVLTSSRVRLLDFKQEQRLRDRLRKLYAESLGLPELANDDLEWQMFVDDLRADSLDVMDSVLEFEEELFADGGSDPAQEAR